MKTVISASRRTDIPAYYLEWFMQKIKEGEVIVQNPLYKKNYKRVDLRPESVEWIVFWSRNYDKLLKYRSFFAEYQLYFHFTIISHHPLLEKAYTKTNKSTRQMEELVKHFGSDKIIWRYDPIVCWEKKGKIQTNYRKSEFEFFCGEFSAMGIDKCYFSYVTDYQKFKRRFSYKYPDLRILPGNENNFFPILREMRKISAKYKISLYSCCNDNLLGKNTVKGHCVSGPLLNTMAGGKIVSEAKMPTRQDCGCTRAVDIGDYIKQPCYFGCIYCYANPVWK
jgi:hypothetical protein